MEKFLRSLKRFVFLSIFLFLGIVFVFVESFSLLRSGKKIVFGSNVNRTSNMLLGSSDDGLSVTSTISADDARPVIIKKYLERYHSPLVPYSDLIFKLSQQYGFEYYWMVAIAQQESNLCKKTPEDSHNCWGYGIHKSGTLKFDSYELALESYARYLKEEYFDKGLNTPELMMGKYCPNSNGSWAKGVQQFIDEMEFGDF